MQPADHSAGGGEERVVPPDPAGLGFDLERDLLVTADPSTGRFTSLNDAWERVLGWSREELMSRPYKDFVHPDDVRATNAATALLAEPGEQLTRFENRYRTAEGGWRWLRWSVRSDGATLIGIAIDVTDEHRAESRIRAAIEDGRLIAHAQPVIELDSGRTVARELLIRMRDPDNPDLVLPAVEFLPEAEADGSVCLIDRWVTGIAIELARRGESVSLNMSASTLADDDTIEELFGRLEGAGTAVENLLFELSETTALDRADEAAEFAGRLGSLGGRLAIDDFGSALASLVRVRELPFDTIKVTRSAVAAMDGDAEQRALVRGIAAMASELGVHAVAVGIERPEVLALCMEFKIELGQGYLLGRPEAVDV